MKTITKGVIFGLAAFAMTGCNFLNNLPGVKTFTMESFVEKANELESKTKELMDEYNSFTVKTTKVVTESEPVVYTLNATKASSGWTSEETDTSLRNEVIAQEIFWSSKTMYKIAKLIHNSQSQYKEYVYELKIDGTYAMEKANSVRMEFNKDGILTSYKDFRPNNEYTLREYTFSKVA